MVGVQVMALAVHQEPGREQCAAAAVPGSGGEVAPEARKSPRKRAPPEPMTEFHIYHANITNWNSKAKNYLQSSKLGLPQVIMLGETHLTTRKLGEARKFIGGSLATTVINAQLQSHHMVAVQVASGFLSHGRLTRILE